MERWDEGRGRYKPRHMAGHGLTWAPITRTHRGAGADGGAVGCAAVGCAGGGAGGCAAPSGAVVGAVPGAI